ncbi:hypothetical protein BTVI_51719 [Pitangus sulphuratus]|nr:hypothetical protein BTVI_51719 [Pitangus sulphuratus]
MGPDRINLSTLKELADVITKPLLKIFESSWKSGEVQADWKLVNVVPVFKKGKKEDPRNYRPVSLTSVPEKSMEKIILGSIEKHRPTTSGVLQVSIIGPVLFNVLDINSLDIGLKGMLSKFADDTRVGGAVKSLRGGEALQTNLDKLEDWAITNQMKFNVGK